MRREVMNNVLESRKTRQNLQAERAYEEYKAKCNKAGKSPMPLETYEKRYQSLTKARAAKDAYASGETQEAFSDRYDRENDSNMWKGGREDVVKGSDDVLEHIVDKLG